MTFKLRQKTVAADAVCVSMVCMVATMLVGFSTPKQPSSAQTPVVLSTVSVAAPAALDAVPEVHISGKSRPDLRQQAAFVVNEPATASIVRRPRSLAEKAQLMPVLGGIDSQLWLAPVANSLDLSLSTYNAAPELFFRGVGFPDIRTYDRGKRSVFDAPGPWAPLVVWRNQNDEQLAAEPIASVRCMGLSPHAVARRADRYREVIYDLARQHDVSPNLVKAVISVESCFNNKALSSVGAQGLMQLMPDTASWLDVSDPHDPVQNLSAGVRYLASLQKQFDTVELTLAAYNAGPGNVRRYNGVPPFAETQAYVVKVQSHYRRYKAAYQLLSAEDDMLSVEDDTLSAEDDSLSTEGGMLSAEDDMLSAEDDTLSVEDDTLRQVSNTVITQ